MGCWVLGACVAGVFVALVGVEGEIEGSNLIVGVACGWVGFRRGGGKGDGGRGEEGVDLKAF